MKSTREFLKDNLKVKVFENRLQLGIAAAEAVSICIENVLKTNEGVNIIFAAAPSQNEFLAELRKRPVNWSRINAFHMDEYIGLDKSAPQSFGHFLSVHLFNHVSCKSVHLIDGNASNMDKECRRYSDLLKQYPTHIVCLGIGENTHIAFNDPYVAKFNDEALVKPIELDIKSREQQVNDGCFESLPQVPTQAVTLTVPALYNAYYMYCIVPGSSKAEAVYHTLTEKVSEAYPSTILRKHANAVLFTDRDSSKSVLNLK